MTTNQDVSEMVMREAEGKETEVLETKAGTLQKDTGRDNSPVLYTSTGEVKKPKIGMSISVSV